MGPGTRSPAAAAVLACVLAVAHPLAPGAPSADARRACALRPLPSRCRIRIPGVSVRIGPPSFSPLSTPPALSAGGPAMRGGGRVASGIAPRGSHGSGRADFPHPALRLTALLRDGGGTDARLRERITLKQPVHALPRNPCPLRAAAQPLAPHA